MLNLEQIARSTGGVLVTSKYTTFEDRAYKSLQQEILKSLKYSKAKILRLEFEDFNFTSRGQLEFQIIGTLQPSYELDDFASSVQAFQFLLNEGKKLSLEYLDSSLHMLEHKNLKLDAFDWDDLFTVINKQLETIAKTAKKVKD